MTAPQQYGYVHRGTITGAGSAAGYWMVRCSAINPARPIGPYPAAAPSLEIGDRVLLTQVGTTRDDLVITSKLPPDPLDSILPIDISDVTGLEDALDARATDLELASAVSTLNAAITAEHDTNVTQDGRLSGHDTAIADLQAADASLDGRLDTAESNIATNTSSIATNTSAIGTHTSQISALNTYSQVFQAGNEFDTYGDLASSFPRLWATNVRTLVHQQALIWRTRVRVGMAIGRIRVMVPTAGVGTGPVIGALYTASSSAGPYTLAASATNALTATGLQAFVFAGAVSCPAGTHILMLLVRTGSYTTSPQIAAFTGAHQVNVGGLNPTSVVWGSKAAVAAAPASITVNDGTWTADAAPWWVAAA